MKNQFTKGPYRITPMTARLVGHQGDTICKVLRNSLNWRDNEALIEAAFSSATKLADMGLDAQATIEALPEIIEAARFVTRGGKLPATSLERLLIRCKGAE